MTSDKFEAILDFLEELMMRVVKYCEKMKRISTQAWKEYIRKRILTEYMTSMCVSCKNLHKPVVKIFEVVFNWCVGQQR